jgi:hypothetical protein
MNNSTKIMVDVEIDVESDLEVDEDGVLNVVTFLYSDSGDDPHEMRTPVETLIDGILEYYSDDLTREGYGEMYRLGHELRKCAERVLSAAEAHEDTVNGEGTYQMPFDFMDE